MPRAPRTNSERYQYLYRSARWRRETAEYIAAHPLCECPHHRGNNPDYKSEVVDHSTPHKGDTQIFWKKANWCAMAYECHNIFKMSEERGGHGFMKGTDDKGWPLHPEHEWYTRDDDG